LIPGLSNKTVTLMAAGLLLLEGWRNVQALTTTSTTVDQITAYGEMVVGALLLFNELG
jgi:hypothetical protein